VISLLLTLADGRIMFEQCVQDKWHSLILDAHQGYISWPRWQQNQKQLAANIMYSKSETPAREGPALLQGVVVCGLCGRRMSPRYHKSNTGQTYHYCYRGLGNTQALPACQIIPGVGIDKAISDLLIEVVTPASLEVALAVQDEVQKRIKEVDQVYHRQVKRASYETDLARRRYMAVDPANCLVAGTLETEWNDKLAALQEAQQEYERRRKVARLELDDETRRQILALATDFPSLWRNPNVPLQDKKRMVRLMIEDVTLIKGENIHPQSWQRTLAKPSLKLFFPCKDNYPIIIIKIIKLLWPCFFKRSIYFHFIIADKLNNSFGGFFIFTISHGNV
jgi:hypothetical protein